MTFDLPSTIEAIEISEPGGPEVLRVARRPLPLPGPSEVMIDVAAAGVNRPDVMQRLGRYPPPPGASDLPGLEVAGTIARVGSAVRDWHPGDRVCALLAGGGYAEYCVVPAVQCLPAPRGLSLVEAAGIPETFFTVWTNVFERGRLVADEALLVHGGASGVGTAAIQLARAFGARVFATAGSPKNCAACEHLGAERAIDYRRDDFVAAIEQATDGRGVDVILDMVGGDYVARNLQILASDGRLVQIAFLHGSTVQIDLWALLRRRLTITGSTLRARSIDEKGRLATAVRERVWPIIENGTVRPVIHATFPLRDAADAHRTLEAGGHFGKLVLVVDETLAKTVTSR